MATVTTSVTGTPIYETFTTLGADQLYQSGVPRSRVIFDQNFATTGTGAGDEENLVVSMDLPINYYYRPLSLQMSFYSGGTDISTWDNSSPRIEIVSNLPATYYIPLG